METRITTITDLKHVFDVVRSPLVALEEELASMVAHTIQDEDYDSAKGFLDEIKRVAALRVTVVGNLEREVIELYDGYMGISWADDSEAGLKNLRTLLVPVTASRVKQHMLTLTRAKNESLVRIGESFKIELPDGQTFETELCEPGCRLRERKMIRHFYESSALKAGQYIVLFETKKGSWKLTTAVSPEGIAQLEKAGIKLPKDTASNGGQIDE